MAEVVFRLHLTHILSFLGLTTELSAVATTCTYWAKIVSQLFKNRDVVLDCFSTDAKYFDFRLQKWIKVEVAPDCTTKHPLAILLIDDVITVIDTCDLIIKQFHPERKLWVEISNPHAGQQYPPMLEEFACAYYDGHIYLVGGHHKMDDSPSSAVWSFNVKTRVWVEYAALPIPFFVCSCAVLLDGDNHPCLTVIGSTVRGGALTNEGFYKPISNMALTDNWQLVAPAPDSIIRLSSRSIVWSQHSIIIGIWMRLHKFTLIEFNLFKNSWEEPYPLPDNYYMFPAKINSQIVALAVDLANCLVTLRYDKNEWRYKIHSPETLNKFSLILGVPHSSVTDR